MPDTPRRSSLRTKAINETWPADASISVQLSTSTHPYRLYRHRFVGLAGLILLNFAAAMGMNWFNSVAVNVTSQFGFSLTKYAWSGRAAGAMYLTMCFMSPRLVTKWGMRRSCDIGAVCLLLGGCIPYASAPRSLSTSGAYALIMIGQMFTGIAQAIFQVLGPQYSETWFNSKGRTTATMAIVLSTILGETFAQAVSPLFDDVRKSMSFLAIISTAFAGNVLLIREKPPTPPTYAATQPSRSLFSVLLGLIGKRKQLDENGLPPMTSREKLDFISAMFVFSVLAAIGSGFMSSVGDEFLDPYGYSPETVEAMRLTFVGSGIIGACISAPLLDRVYTRHHALVMKILAPIFAVGWLSLVWAVRANNASALFVFYSLCGLCSIPLMPIALELGVEVSRGALSTCVLFWMTAGNIGGMFFSIVGSFLRAKSTGSPPFNMRNVIILQASFAFLAAVKAIMCKGERTRSITDEEENAKVIGIPIQGHNTRTSDTTEEADKARIEMTEGV